jgi:hypothetical protein
MKKILNLAWLILSRSAVIAAFVITSTLVGWNKGHDTGYVHAMADVTLGQVNAEQFMIDYWIGIGRLDPTKFNRKKIK